MIPTIRRTFALAAALLAWSAEAGAQLHYTVDVRNGATHAATVTLRVDSLAARDSVFQFASTAPGTYQTMNVGRYVRSFRATDARGRTVPTSRLSTNTWQIHAPGRVRRVSYTVADTWHTPVTEFPIYPMSGTDIDTDHALLNTHALLGFPRGMQASAVTVRLQAPAGWTTVTPLAGNGPEYHAASYDEMVDSPFLLGRELSLASLTVAGAPVRIAVYSPSKGITAPQLMEAMRGTLEAAGNFMGRLPVDRYVFLYRFTPKSPGAMGAWEHGTSSEYVLPDTVYVPQLGNNVTSIATHEFFHVITPLNVHSEIIEHFNFERPVPSRHLWLYEGVTEWAAQKMRQESGLIPLEAYFRDVVRKARIDRTQYDTTWSLARLAATSYTEEGARQYGNIYMRGALTASMLDIRLLQLSGGRSGLRTLLRGLAHDYGKSRPFPEDSLFDIIARRTSPEVLDFFHRYIENAQPLPLRESFALLGIDMVTDDKGIPTRLELNPNATPDQLRLREAWLKGGTDN